MGSSFQNLVAPTQNLGAPGDRAPLGSSLERESVEKLHELEQMDIIEKVKGPTPWVSPIVVVPKHSGEIRLCIDMRKANEAVVRERHPIPTVDEVLQDMTQSSVLTKLDLKWGYHQLELSEESRDTTTFTTHAGLYRYKSRVNVWHNICSRDLSACYSTTSAWI